MPESELQRSLKQALPLFQANLQADDDALIATLAAAGIDQDLARRIVLFAPLAFTRAFFEKSKVTFADTYHRLNADGTLGPEQRLDEEPVFVLALTLARVRDFSGPYMLAVAARNGAFQALNQALRQGRKLENLMVSPAIVMGGSGPAPPPGDHPPEARPWWQFWK